MTKKKSAAAISSDTVPGTIQVDLEVTSCEVFRADDMVQVWGYVGDYQVCLWLPLDDPRVQPFVRRDK